MKKTKTLPAFTGYPKKGALAQFIFEYEPEGIAECRRFRAQLVRALNQSQGARWVEARNPSKSAR